jgi:preprotein translocase subunit SecG
MPAARSERETLLAGIAIAIHLLLSLALIALILLHAGRGGGLSDAFGGGMGPLGGLGGSTLAERNLDRITVTVALLFASTTLALAWVLE